MRIYRVSRAAQVTYDLDLVGVYRVRVYQDFGDDLENAVARAAVRIDEALAHMRTFETYPHQGTEHPASRTSVRAVTYKNFVFYFDIDEASSEVRILAVFFGAANHRRQIIDRLRN